MAFIYKIQSTDGTVVFDNSNIIGLPTLTIQANTDTNINLGASAAGELIFDVVDQSMQLPTLEGKTFIYTIESLDPYIFRDTTLLEFRDGNNYYFRDGEIQMGIFHPDKIERINDTRWKIKMFDNLYLFNKDITEWLANQTWPKTIIQIYDALCTFVGIQRRTVTLPNGNYAVSKTFSGENITARDLLKWIGEATCRFFIVDAQGYLNAKWYSQTDNVVDNSNTFKLKVADYTTDAITKLRIHITENDIGVIVGSGTNQYTIRDNPLLYATSDAQLRAPAQNILNELSVITYAPTDVEIINGSVIAQPGDIYTVNSYREDGLKTIAMKTIMTPGKVRIVSTGDKQLSNKTAVNKVIKRLEGRTNEIVATIDEFSVTLTDLGIAQANFTIRANQIETTVSDLRTSTDQQFASQSSRITQTANSITSEITARTNADSALSTRITQTNDSIRFDVSQSISSTETSLNNKINNTNAALGDATNRIASAESSLSIQAGQIASKVSTTDYNGNTLASMINQTSTVVAIEASKINLTGYLTLHGMFDSWGSDGTLVRQEGGRHYYYDVGGILTGFFMSTGSEMMWETRNQRDIFLASDRDLHLAGAGTTYVTTSNMQISCQTTRWAVAGRTNAILIGVPVDPGYQEIGIIPEVNNTGNVGSGQRAFDQMVSYAYNSGSTRRIKKNISPILPSAQLDEKFTELQPVMFDWKDPELAARKGRQFGFIAEEVFELFPSVVHLDKEGIPETVDYSKFSVLCVQQIQQLVTRVQRLERRLNGDDKGAS